MTRVSWLALVVLLSGCIVVPPVWDAGDEIFQLDFIEPGVTTKDEVLANLGEPDWKSEEAGSVSFSYSGEMTMAGAWFMVLPIPAYETFPWWVTIQFDENDVVTMLSTSEGEVRVSETAERLRQEREELKREHQKSLRQAKCGDPEAQWSVAYDFENGYRTRQDQKKAYFWYSVATRHGVSSAAFGFGRVSDRLPAEDRDELDRKIKQWQPIECAVETEHETSFPRAKRVPPNAEAEALWYSYVNNGLSQMDRLISLCRAADQGHQVARLELARKFWFGRSPFRKDRVRAQMWLMLAARLDGQYAESQRRYHAEQLTDDELLAASAFAEVWEPGDCEADLPGATVSATN